MNLITTTDKLEEFCQRAKFSDYITIDTEFIRESSYWPQLCLIQVADEHNAVAIDPLSADLDLGPLFALLQNPDVVKVFHAARQDIEIFYYLTNKIPTPVFDTQIAAMVCGFGEAVSYEVLVNTFAKMSIDKSQRFTNWAQRPLSEKQLSYALGDVIHLRIIYEKLLARITKVGRHEWLSDELGVLLSPSTYNIDPYEVWRKIRYRSAKPQMLAVLREVAAWRELYAQKKDLPRNRVLRDEILLEIAAAAPKNLEELTRIRGMSAGFLEKNRGEEILALILKASSLPLEECPQPKISEKSPPGHNVTMEMLKMLLKLKCDQHGVAQKLVATVSDLEDIARNAQGAIPALTGWRRDIFGEDALALKAGKLAITLKNNKIELLQL